MSLMSATLRSMEVTRLKARMSVNSTATGGPSSEAARPGPAVHGAVNRSSIEMIT